MYTFTNLLNLEQYTHTTTNLMNTIPNFIKIVHQERTLTDIPLIESLKIANYCTWIFDA
jgi:hypothetical protein